jgi:hypothetical protein
LRLSISTAILLGGIITAQAADDASCVASPTRACVLTMAVNAIEPLADTDRMLLIWQTAQAVIRSAAEAGQPDLARGLVSSFDQSYSGIDIGPLFVAMKLTGREKDLPPAMAQNRSFDMYTGPALVANGRDADFAQLVKSRKLSGYDLAGMQMAGDLMAGHADEALAVLAPFTGDDRTNAVTRTLEMLLLARRMDVSGPMFAHLDLATPDGVAACARIAEGTKDRATAERCADALDGLPPKAKADYYGAGTIIPEVVGALAAVGDSEQALALIRAQPRDAQKAAFVKLSNMPIRPSCFRSPGKSLYRARPRAARIWSGCWFSADNRRRRRPSSRRRVTMRCGTRATEAEAEALAEIGNPAAALPLANTITDPVLRARALAAVADALKS